MQNDKLKTINNLINALFSDKTLALEETLECMEDIQTTVETNINALEDDIENQ